MDVVGKCCITSMSCLVDILGICALNGIVDMRSGSVCFYDTAAACTQHDCFILKREDAVRFVVIYKKDYGGPCVLIT